MEEIIKFISFVNTNISAVSLLVVVIGGIFAWIKFREYVKDKRFNTYHDLIQKLIDPGSHPSGTLKLDRQIAIVFELRSFPKYYKVSRRILEGLRETWKDSSPRIINEIDLTLRFISRNTIVRFFKND